MVLYNEFPNIGGIVHTHSEWGNEAGHRQEELSRVMEQRMRIIFMEKFPCVRNLTKEEIEEAYEKNTGVLIADYFRKLDYEAVPAVLCKNHGPFTLG